MHRDKEYRCLDEIHQSRPSGDGIAADITPLAPCIQKSTDEPPPSFIDNKNLPNNKYNESNDSLARSVLIVHNVESVVNNEDDISIYDNNNENLLCNADKNILCNDNEDVLGNINDDLVEKFNEIGYRNVKAEEELVMIEKFYNNCVELPLVNNNENVSYVIEEAADELNVDENRDFYVVGEQEMIIGDNVVVNKMDSVEPDTRSQQEVLEFNNYYDDRGMKSISVDVSEIITVDNEVSRPTYLYLEVRISSLVSSSPKVYKAN
ncbi:hypothetical protein KPH14_000939 [Odynerus spinipes]|uniref:Uncharacterized protein n=1 Tax=Odynerus spinipes TaxID=1348599 RepID=A0AAD9RFA5_9HYME|nr:hypothetical protein KPH14_000939 [Odynerus spinipes]